eukprot:TRINITY_DN11571_c0_g3_i2.p1 TRINITY_DN11571_c0_g3~~TRINITY_DN11571_c0_g3_i2.p1  ORF type:complete len:185 (-),score=14.54 TRINITY_DN11571_c0_g3_i2:216-770(-)
MRRHAMLVGRLLVVLVCAAFVHGDTAASTSTRPISLGFMTLSPPVSSLVLIEADQNGNIQVLLQLEGSSYEITRTSIESLIGKALVHYLPENSFIVSIEAAVLASLRSLAGITWIGPYKPEYKYREGLLPKLSDVRSHSATEIVFEVLVDTSSEQHQDVAVEGCSVTTFSDLLVVCFPRCFHTS